MYMYMYMQFLVNDSSDQDSVEEVGGGSGREDGEVAEGLAELRKRVQSHLRSHGYHV